MAEEFDPKKTEELLMKTAQTLQAVKFRVSETQDVLLKQQSDVIALQGRLFALQSQLTQWKQSEQVKELTEVRGKLNAQIKEFKKQSTRLDNVQEEEV